MLEESGLEGGGDKGTFGGIADDVVAALLTHETGVVAVQAGGEGCAEDLGVIGGTEVFVRRG